MSAASGEMMGAQSVDRALNMLAMISRNPEAGVSLSAITREMGLSWPTARRLLLALIRARLVEQDPLSRAYALGDGAYVLGVLASRRFSLVEMAAESVAALAAGSGDTAFLSTRQDGFSVCLHKEEGSFPSARMYCRWASATRSALARGRWPCSRRSQRLKPARCSNRTAS